MLFFFFIKEIQEYLLFSLYGFIFLFFILFYFKEELLILLLAACYELIDSSSLLCTGILDILYSQIYITIFISIIFFLFSFCFNCYLLFLPTFFRFQVLQQIKIFLLILLILSIYIYISIFFYFEFLGYILEESSVKNYYISYFTIELKLLDFCKFFILFFILLLLFFLLCTIIFYLTIIKINGGVNLFRKIIYSIILSCIIFFIPPDFFLHIYIFSFMLIILELAIYAYLFLYKGE